MEGGYGRGGVHVLENALKPHLVSRLTSVLEGVKAGKAAILVTHEWTKVV